VSGTGKKLKFGIGLRWLWIEKLGIEFLRRPNLTKSCSAKERRRGRSVLF